MRRWQVSSWIGRESEVGLLRVGVGHPTSQVVVGCNRKYNARVLKFNKLLAFALPCMCTFSSCPIRSLVRVVQAKDLEVLSFGAQLWAPFCV